MRIAISPDRYAEWDRGSRTINLFTLTPYAGDRALYWGPRWVNDDVISFGYEEPTRMRVTQIKMLDALLSRLVDEAVFRHPAGTAIRCSCSPDCDGE